MIERVKEIVDDHKGDKQVGPKEGTHLREAIDRLGARNPEMAKALNMMYGSFVEVINGTDTLTGRQKEEAQKALENNNLPLQYKLCLEIDDRLESLHRRPNSQTKAAIDKAMPIIKTAEGVITRSLRDMYGEGFTKLSNFINHASLQDVVAFVKVDGVGYYDRLMGGHDYMNEKGSVSPQIRSALAGVNLDPDKTS